MSNKVAEPALEQLMQEREEIERGIGAKLQWDPNPENRDKIIVLDRNCVLADRNAWPDHLDWLVDQVDKFKKAFAPRIKRLDLSTPPEQEG